MRNGGILRKDDRDLLPVLSEREVRARIAAAQAFFTKYPNIFTQSFFRRRDFPSIQGEAHRLKGDLDIGVKSLLAQGGVIPVVLYDAQKLEQKLGLIARRDHAHYYKYVQLLSDNVLDPVIINAEWNVRICAFAVLRMAFVKRKILLPDEEESRNHDNRSLKLSEAPDALIVEETLPAGLYDAVHLLFTCDKPEQDFGWVAPNHRSDTFQQLIHRDETFRKRTEGTIWNMYRAAELIRHLTRSKIKDVSRLTLISETVGPDRIKSGVLPRFSHSKISFAPLDITSHISDSNASAFTTDAVAKLRDREMAAFLSRVIRREIALVIGGQQDFIRGGRAGLTPSNLYNPQLIQGEHSPC